MMRRRSVFVWLGSLAVLLTLCGCNGTTTESTELKGQVEQLQADLEETTAQRDAFKQDIGKLENSLNAAETTLASTSQVVATVFRARCRT